MPGNVAAAGTLSDSYPFTRFRAFTVSHVIEAAVSEYPDGSSQRRKKATNHKRLWSVAHLLTAADADTLRTFWKSHLTTAFNFTDASNAVTYKAVFAGAWQEERTVGDRYMVTLDLIEIA